MATKLFGLASVYYDNINYRTLKPSKKVEINWACIGATSPAKVKQFIKQLQKAVIFAENLKKSKVIKNEKKVKNDNS